MTDTTAHFEQLAPGWAERYTSSPSFRQRLEVVGSTLTRYLEATPESLVLDLGTGAGIFAMVASASAARVVAVEPNGAMVQAASRELSFVGEMLAQRNVRARADRISFVQGDLACLKPASHAFDVVTAIAVLEYLNNPSQTARALRGCLSERGILCVTWPSSRSLFRKIERLASRAVAYLGRRSKNSALHSRDYVQYQSGVTGREWKRAFTAVGLVPVERIGLPMGNQGWRLLARPSELVVFAVPTARRSCPTGTETDSLEA